MFFADNVRYGVTSSRFGGETRFFDPGCFEEVLARPSRIQEEVIDVLSVAAEPHTHWPRTGLSNPVDRRAGSHLVGSTNRAAARLAVSERGTF